MSTDPVTRRRFLQTAAVGSTLAAAAPADEPARLPRKVLGKTKVSAPIIGLGTAPAGQLSEKEAVALYHACIDAGVTYVDTAPELGGYGNAQKFLAPVLKDRRDQVFVVTKCYEPDGDQALKLLKSNLAEMGIERADLVYAPSIGGGTRWTRKSSSARTGRSRRWTRRRRTV